MITLINKINNTKILLPSEEYISPFLSAIKDYYSTTYRNNTIIIDKIKPTLKHCQYPNCGSKNILYEQDDPNTPCINYLDSYRYKLVSPEQYIPIKPE